VINYAPINENLCRVEVSLHKFLTLAKDGGEFSHLVLFRFNSGETTPVTTG
jgi:hypothetical protein